MNKTKETFIILFNVITFLVTVAIFIMDTIYLIMDTTEILYATWSTFLVLACLILCVAISVYITFAARDNGFHAFAISNIAYAVFSLVFLIDTGFGLNTATVILSVINALFILTNLSLLSLSKTEQTETPTDSEMPIIPAETQNISRGQTLKETETKQITREQALKEIEKLKKLKESGVITEEEFREKSKKYVEIIL